MNFPVQVVDSPGALDAEIHEIVSDKMFSELIQVPAVDRSETPAPTARTVSSKRRLRRLRTNQPDATLTVDSVDHFAI